MALLSLVVAVIVVAVLSAGAMAVRAVSRLWLRHWIEHRQPATRSMRGYLERPARLAHAAATGISLAVFVWGAVLASSEGLRTWSFAVDAVLGVLALLVFGQLLPRAVGRRWAPNLVPILVPVLRVVDVIVTPFLRIADWASKIVIKRRGIGDTRDGLGELLRDGAFEELGATEEIAIISGVMQFGDKTVADVMTPRADIFALDATLPPREVADRLAQSGYSRVPMYRGQLDHVVGMIHVFDVFKVGGERLPTLRPLTRTSPTKPANELLFELLRARRQLAVVFDVAGSVVGLVTLEDLLEELVGEIRDEHDEPSGDGMTPGRL